MATGQGGRDGDEDAGRDDDPFAGLTLDDDFVASAEVREESAEDRVARLQRIDREHRALAADRERERKAAAAADRKLAKRRPSSATATGTSSRKRWRTVVVLAVLVGLFVYVTFLRDRGGDSTSSSASSTESSSTADTASSEGNPSIAPDPSSAPDRPPAGLEESTAPLGQPGPHPTGAGAFTFKDLQDDGSTPIAFDPCRPIHYVVNGRTAPADGAQLVEEAVARVSAATGLQFVFDGATDEAPVTGTEAAPDFRADYQPARYGERWAPVLIAWSDPAESVQLDGLTTGLGTGLPESAEPGGAYVYVTGGVVLDGPQLLEKEREVDGAARVRAAIQHELGHLVGLGHVDDATQLMQPSEAVGVTDYKGGDLEGLARLGQGACFPGI